MEKRLILALALSFVVLFSWSAFVVKPAQKATIPVLTAPSTQGVETEVKVEKSESLPENPASFEIGQFEYENSANKIVFSEPSAAIKELTFTQYGNYPMALKYGLLVGDKKWRFSRQSVDSSSVTYLYVDKEKNITKHFTFDNSKYATTLDINVQNISPAQISLQIPLILGVLNTAVVKGQPVPQDIIVADAEKNVRPNIHKSNEFKRIKFVGLREKYFCAIIQPVSSEYSAEIIKINNNETEVGILSPMYEIASGQSINLRFEVYFGPQDLKIIGSNKKDWQEIINYGVFDIIAQIMLQLMNFFFHIVHNWGVVVIIMSFLLYIVLYPLTLQQMRSMKVMQTIQPQMEEIKKQYKDNPQRMNKEIMELYKINKVNPLGGCLPLILQIPVFFALYQVLTRSIALKGASFWWIKDLVEPDRLFVLSNALPLIGKEINILPVLMATMMFFQQKASMSKMGGNAAEQQKMLLIMMPVMMVIFFYRMPAGLVLYWFINSALTMAYQLKVSQSK